MKAYADTGFLVSVHCRDANTAEALSRMGSQSFPLAWTWLHDLEFRNGLRLRVFRDQMTDGEVSQVLEKVKARTTQGVYRAMAVPPAAFDEAERLSATYSAKFGTRSLDILHVAHALVLGTSEFLTFDRRQADLAEAAGLKVPKLS